MPTVHNGIGTWYYGKKNLQTRPGVCDFCHKPANLKSYDTRLWFVFLMIPVIPLGRKRILDDCPLCTRHRTLPLGKWEELKKNNISEAMAAMQERPQDPKAAIKLHSALTAFGQMAEADKLTALMKERFPGDAETLAYLGSNLEYHGRSAEAVPYFEKALQLNPDLPEARIAVALNLIDHERLDDARKLLQIFEAPGDTRAPGALYALAMGYQKANRHPDAVRLFNLLAERFPKLAQDKGFRKAVKRSEAAAGVGESNLPLREVNWKLIWGLGGAAVFILLILLGSNFWIEQTRTLYLVSGLPHPVTVEIAGHGSVIVMPRRESQLTLPEGDYQATIKGAPDQKMEVKMHSGFWQRWSAKPVFLLNVSGSALLIVQTTTYAERALPSASAGGYSFLYGKPFITLPQVDYPFEPFPPTVTLSSHESTVQKTRVDLFEPATEAFYALAERKQIPKALDLAEWRLGLHPEEAYLLRYYVYYGKQGGQEARTKAFIKENIKRRPIEVEWHRTYQEIQGEGRDADAALAAEYDALLQAEPENSALLYLRGRLYPTKRLETPVLERAIANDPKNALAHFALGHTYSLPDQWSKALGHYQEAVRLEPTNAQFRSGLFNARMALHDYAGLETDLRAAIAKEPLDPTALLELGQVLAALNKKEEMDKVEVSATKTAQARWGAAAATDWLMSLQATFRYASGQFEALENLGGKKAPARRAAVNFAAQVELGHLSEAAGLLNAQPVEQRNPFDELALCIASHRAGDEARAAEARKGAIAAFEHGRSSWVAAADLLKRDQPASIQEMKDLSMSPQEIALLSVVEAQRDSVHKDELLALAQGLNTPRTFPYHLIERVTGPSAER